MSELPVAGRYDNGDIVIDTTEPTRALAVLTTWAIERSLELPGLEVTRPSLEDVYLELAGQ